MTTRTRLRLLAGWLCGLLLAGCVPGTPTAGPSPRPSGPDFTAPGVAAAMVDTLLERAGSRYALMVEITAKTVAVSVLDAEQATATWAYRDGEIGEVTSDLAYVDQAVFAVAGFRISDVGALFRAAEGQSGSAENQSLTIVDYSGGEVMMSVSTVPETRTVFFTPEGALLPILDFDTPAGIAEGIRDAIGTRMNVSSITVDSAQGVTVEYPGEAGTTVRRTRTAKVPVTTNVIAQEVDQPPFLASQVDAAAIWRVVDSARGTAEEPEGTRWSVVIDDREGLGTPRLHVSISSTVIITDTEGNTVNG